MFTGLIQDIGTIASVHSRADGRTLVIRTALPVAEFELGESVAVQGACLTVTAVGEGVFHADVSQETLRWTTFAQARPGTQVHLERALRLSDRLGGHLVQGHVDALGTVISASRTGAMWDIWISAPDEAIAGMIDKGSITIDGVSLTINTLEASRFRLTIVPFTAEHTLLGAYRSGQRVHLETDVLGKYVRRMLTSPGSAPGTSSKNTLAEALRRHGFLDHG